ncbi:hypothetical protein BABINDRAFT_171456 [Babjeviella inositovora NRRL Y-12698]|uniref:Uncharacterized protein n=1 Tax=Babjeviella inositovora NRRL Y-12698 TaxID=984486 RepID=A0A1E3QSF3_9ASCO|nr:uncharacterized protein BABINDRAFT_171456 [Babjeviella inositovora NRRL Y-12698]ODQ79867.1 hypothetical protein BABINDRAFT_171456 [Babjeviella inositovora NRRL Y-12698]
MQALASNPLLTKAVTAAILVSLNEQIASLLAGDLQTMRVCSLKFLHTLTVKVPLMALYGFAISAPISHFGYDILNKIFQPPLSGKAKLLQILTSLVTITPLSGACFVAYLALLNLKALPTATTCGAKLQNAVEAIKTNWKNNLLPVLRTSWIVSPLVTFLAQTYVPPQLWVIFFNVIYFFLGTGQNALLAKQQSNTP